MLTTYKQIIKKAYRQHWAIGAFNTANLEISQAIIEAAEEMRSPVIIQTSEKTIQYAGLEEIAEIMKSLARKAKVPVIINLDHGKSYNDAVRAAKAGYTALMFDGSKLTFKNNISQTKKIVQLGKRYHIGVEGELGKIGGEEDYIKSHKIVMTKPGDAKEFVRKTGIDLLAPAFGSAHGLPQKGEHLDIKRLKAIRDSIPTTPLVFHGASSTRKDLIKKSIRLGVSKVNIDTDLRMAFSHAVRAYLKKNASVYDPRDILGKGKEAVKKIVKDKIILFGSQRKA
ncbi:ketose-bisphosphate aldolase [Patescibacteria group bacterium]